MCLYYFFNLKKKSFLKWPATSGRLRSQSWFCSGSTPDLPGVEGRESKRSFLLGENGLVHDTPGVGHASCRLYAPPN